MFLMRLRVESLRAAWKGDGSSAPALPRVVFAAKCVCLAPLLPAAGLAGEPSGADESAAGAMDVDAEQPKPSQDAGDGFDMFSDDVEEVAVALEDGGDEAVDGRRLEEARTALDSMRQMLAAFAGVDDDVCVQLGVTIAETAALLARAERRRAQACGRQEMAAQLQQALRTVGAHSLGEGYNVVRETLLLPGVVAAVLRTARQVAMVVVVVAQIGRAHV